MISTSHDPRDCDLVKLTPSDIAPPAVAPIFHSMLPPKSMTFLFPRLFVFFKFGRPKDNIKSTPVTVQYSL